MNEAITRGHKHCKDGSIQVWAKMTTNRIENEYRLTLNPEFAKRFSSETLEEWLLQVEVACVHALGDAIKSVWLTGKTITGM